MNRDGAGGAVGRGDEPQAPALVRVLETLLLVARGDTESRRLDPDLQEVNARGLRVIEFAVRDAAAGAHALHIPGADHRARADGILVRELALEHIGDDLHVLVAVGRESGARDDAIFIDDTQRAEFDMLRIVVAGERERVIRIEPAVVGVTALAAAPYFQHRRTP